jgi:hypothetical protein
VYPEENGCDVAEYKVNREVFLCGKVMVCFFVGVGFNARGIYTARTAGNSLNEGK